MSNREGKSNEGDGAPVPGRDQADHAKSANAIQTVEEPNLPAEEPTVDHAIQNHLGRKLKEVYDDLVNQPVPERFRELLQQLERKENKQ